MNKALAFTLVALIAITVSLGVAVTEYNQHKANKTAADYSALQKATTTLKLHDEISAKNQATADAALKALNDKRLTLCNVIKTTKVAFDPTLCQ